MGLKETLADGRPVGTWLSVGHPIVAEVTASLGFDFMLIDTEHTSMGLETLENMVRAVEAVPGGTEPVVRVPSTDRARIKRVLDTGVSGVMVPSVDTVEEARLVVESTRYPPEGDRGVASGRASDHGLSFEEYVNRANEEMVVILQIESRTGVENAGDIAGVEGVDATFVGPADLSAALGEFGGADTDRLGDAIEQVLDTCQRRGTPVGTLAIDTDDVPLRIDQGFDFLIVGKDTAHLASANRHARERYERALERADACAISED